MLRIIVILGLLGTVLYAIKQEKRKGEIQNLLDHQIEQINMLSDSVCWAKTQKVSPQKYIQLRAAAIKVYNFVQQNNTSGAVGWDWGKYPKVILELDYRNHCLQ